MNPLVVQDLGRMAYEPALRLQLELVERVKAARTAGDADPAWLLLVEHDPPVITIGRRGSDADILASRDRLTEMGIDVHESSRGGGVTYHGPGQLVGYAIMDLDRHGRNVRGHVRNLEETIIQTLKHYDISAGRKDKLTGVWIDALDNPAGRDEKIAAIGVAVTRWVSYHGFALNVMTDMSHFDLIVPCGIRDKGVTSMQCQIGRPVKMTDVKERLAANFAGRYNFSQVEWQRKGL